MSFTARKLVYEAVNNWQTVDAPIKTSALSWRLTVSGAQLMWRHPAEKGPAGTRRLVLRFLVWCYLAHRFMHLPQWIYERQPLSITGTLAKKLLCWNQEKKKGREKQIWKIYFYLQQGCMIYAICLFEWNNYSREGEGSRAEATRPLHHPASVSSNSCVHLFTFICLVVVFHLQWPAWLGVMHHFIYFFSLAFYWKIDFCLVQEHLWWKIWMLHSWFTLVLQVEFKGVMNIFPTFSSNFLFTKAVLFFAPLKQTTVATGSRVRPKLASLPGCRKHQKSNSSLRTDSIVNSGVFCCQSPLSSSF